MSKIYVLQHKSPAFTGQVGHVGFENGKGTTSSKQDADFCCAETWFKGKKRERLNLNPCTLVRVYTPESPEIIAEKEKMAKVRKAKKPNAKEKASKKETKKEEKSEVEPK